MATRKRPRAGDPLSKFSDKLAGLVITANGQRIPWTRDPLDVYAFKLDVPAGVSSLDVAFQFISPTDPQQGRVVMTPAMLNLQWNTVALYPAGYAANRISVAPSVTLPPGWQAATALETATRNGNVVRYQTVDLETLVDSPLFAGRHFKSIDLDMPATSGGAKVPVRLNIVADDAKQLEIKPDHLEAHKRLVQQADKLFGARHFAKYDFLLALSDQMGGIGLEHHESSENGVTTKYWENWDKAYAGRDLLAHEYVHSWNGKFRRPRDLTTPHYNTPMQDSLLWLYEGQTQYWGKVLAARSALVSAELAAVLGKHAEWLRSGGRTVAEFAEGWKAVQFELREICEGCSLLIHSH